MPPAMAQCGARARGSDLRRRHFERGGLSRGLASRISFGLYPREAPHESRDSHPEAERRHPPRASGDHCRHRCFDRGLREYQIENHPVASWAGLLQHGLEYCRTLGLTDGTQDGFELARRDLELRGPGELLGTRQAGLHHLKVADLGRDGDLLTAVEDSGRVLLRRHPECVDALIRRWLGDALHYGSV